MSDPQPTALIPTCANTFGERGHKWRVLIGGRRCDVCGKQEAYGEPPKFNVLPFAMSWAAYMRAKACMRGQINFAISGWNQ